MKQLTDYIFKKNIFPFNLCDEIVREYSNENFFRRNNSIGTRNLGEINLSDYGLINKKNSYTRKKIENDIFNNIGNCIEEYVEMTQYHLPIKEDVGYSMRKMVQGDYYGKHDDQAIGIDTTKLTITIVINDEFKGGNFTFFDEEIIYEFKKGDVIMFPSNFMYPHSVQPITEGVRYNLTTWLR